MDVLLVSLGRRRFLQASCLVDLPSRLPRPVTPRRPLGLPESRNLCSFETALDKLSQLLAVVRGGLANAAVQARSRLGTAPGCPSRPG